MTETPQIDPDDVGAPVLDEATLRRLQRMADAAHALSVWNATPTEQTPTVSLSAWRVMELGDGSRHLVGTDLTERSDGRVSSHIVSVTGPGDGFVTVSPGTRPAAVVVTASGRTYHLVGAPGRSGDSEYVWRRWLDGLGSPEWVDVTATVLSELQHQPRGEEE